MTADGSVIRVRRTDLPADSDGAPIPPAKVVEDRYVFCWTDRQHGDLVFTRNANDLLSEWWPAYRSADYDTRQRMRLEHAAATRSQLAADMVVAAEAAGTDLTAPQREQLLLPTSRLDELAGLIWSSTVPLVLIEGAFAPDTTLPAPISGTDGDVREPRNLIWLRPRTAEGYVLSLARAGQIELAILGR